MRHRIKYKCLLIRLKNGYNKAVVSQYWLHKAKKECGKVYFYLHSFFARNVAARAEAIKVINGLLNRRLFDARLEAEYGSLNPDLPASH
jgi:hypothetical protein